MECVGEIENFFSNLPENKRFDLISFHVVCFPFRLVENINYFSFMRQ